SSVTIKRRRIPPASGDLTTKWPWKQQASRSILSENMRQQSTFGEVWLRQKTMEETRGPPCKPPIFPGPKAPEMSIYSAEMLDSSTRCFINPT
ncbi:Hypothetical predicted protein, partial [Podarcis lilfordi]